MHILLCYFVWQIGLWWRWTWIVTRPWNCSVATDCCPNCKPDLNLYSSFYSYWIILERKQLTRPYYPKGDVEPLLENPVGEELTVQEKIQSMKVRKELIISVSVALWYWGHMKAMLFPCLPPLHSGGQTGMNTHKHTRYEVKVMTQIQNKHCFQLILPPKY